MTRSAPRPAAARRAQAATAHGRKAAGEGDDVGRSGHCQSRLREERRGAAGRPLTRMPAPGLAPAGPCCHCGGADSVSARPEPAGRQGFTLYSFAPDTPSRSNCNGTCAGYWPPVTGTPAAGPGVTGKLGTIKRSDGTTQAVYNGHPLYTYIADTAPGQAHGNNLNLNGGLWHEVTVSG